jgi:hypothetical protein
MGNSSTVTIRSTAVTVQAETARPECGHLQKAAGHRHVLEELDELVLVGELFMERERGGNREGGKNRDAGLVGHDKSEATAYLRRNRDGISKP